MNTNNILKTISAMSRDEINEYPTENWMQGRTLLEAKNLNSARYYYGCYTYKQALDNRIDATTHIFETAIKELTETDIYLDIGAGNGMAIKQYRELYPNGARVVGIACTQPHQESINDVIEQDRTDDKYSFYLADFLQFSTNPLEGRVAVITDVIGALRYGRDPARVIQQVGKLLKEGGLVFFKFTRMDWVNIPEGYTNIISGRGRGLGCLTLFKFWFYTIRGFDVLQGDMTLNESKEYHKEVVKDFTKVTRHEFGDDVVVLRRSADSVEVDPLIIDAQADEKCQKRENGQLHWDRWRPNYTWKMSDYSKSLLKNPEERLVIM